MNELNDSNALLQGEGIPKFEAINSMDVDKYIPIYLNAGTNYS